MKMVIIQKYIKIVRIPNYTQIYNTLLIILQIVIWMVEVLLVDINSASTHVWIQLSVELLFGRKQVEIKADVG